MQTPKAALTLGLRAIDHTSRDHARLALALRGSHLRASSNGRLTPWAQ